MKLKAETFIIFLLLGLFDPWTLQGQGEPGKKESLELRLTGAKGLPAGKLLDRVQELAAGLTGEIVGGTGSSV